MVAGDRNHKDVPPQFVEAEIVEGGGDSSDPNDPNDPNDPTTPDDPNAPTDTTGSDNSGSLIIPAVTENHNTKVPGSTHDLDKIPYTGVGTNILVRLSLMCLSGLAVVVIDRRHKKSKASTFWITL